MNGETIGDQQATLDQWYGEWLNWQHPDSEWNEKTPESLLSYFKTRLGVTFGPLAD